MKSKIMFYAAAVIMLLAVPSFAYTLTISEDAGTLDETAATVFDLKSMTGIADLTTFNGSGWSGGAGSWTGTADATFVLDAIPQNFFKRQPYIESQTITVNLDLTRDHTTPGRQDITLKGEGTNAAGYKVVVDLKADTDRNPVPNTGSLEGTVKLMGATEPWVSTGEAVVSKTSAVLHGVIHQGKMITYQFKSDQKIFQGSKSSPATNLSNMYSVGGSVMFQDDPNGPVLPYKPFILVEGLTPNTTYNFWIEAKNGTDTPLKLNKGRKVEFTTLPLEAAFIASSADLATGFDAAQVDHLEELGMAVMVVAQDDIEGFAPDAAGYDLLVVSESIGSSAANPLIGTPTPMMHQESYGWSRHFMTLGLGKKWVNDPNGMVDVVDVAHPITADAGVGLGQVQFFTNPGASWTTDLVESVVPGGVNLVQVTANDEDNTIIFAIDAGVELADGSAAAAKICGFSIPGNDLFAAEDMTDDAWALYDSAIDWLLAD